MNYQKDYRTVPTKPAQKPDWFSHIKPTSIGFDSLFEHVESLLKGSMPTNYPPYNIVKVDDTRYYVEMALAGFSRDDVQIDLLDNSLTVRSSKVSSDASEESYLHRGIAGRYFERTFSLAENIEVVVASMENGMLRVDFERIVPEEQKPRSIEIK